MSLLLRRATAAARGRAVWRVQCRRLGDRVAIAPMQATGVMPWRHGLAAMAHSPWRFMTTQAATATTEPAAAAAATADASFEGAKAALVEQLRPLCSALYTENRASVTADELVAQWEAQLSTLLRSDAVVAEPRLGRVIAQTYEQGVAIAFKQREFDLAQALIEQMKKLGVATDEKLYEFQIRAVPLQWITRERPLKLEEFRKLDLSGSNWESSVLELVHTDGQPHYRTSPAERQHFSDYLRKGVTSVLKAYEAEVPKDKQRVEPYNAAIRAYSSNGMAFAQMLRLLNSIPSGSAARTALNADTFLALLEGARWNDIPLTVERLAKSNVFKNLTSTVEQDGSDSLEKIQSQTASRIWDRAMRAICNSYTDRFFSKRTRIDGQALRELRNIFLDVEAQLLRQFPVKTFASVEEHNAVYEIRVKTTALLGLPRQVHSLLNEYKARAPVEFASGQLGKSVFLKALEIFPSVGLKPVNHYVIERFRTHDDVLESRAVADLNRSIDDLEKNVIPAKKAAMEKAKSARGPEGEEVYKVSNRELRKSLQTVVRLKKRLDATIAQVSEEVAHQHRLGAADRSMDIVLDHLRAGGKKADPLEDLEVAVAIMNQYMTTANRFAARMNQPTRDLVGSQIMLRVWNLLDVVVGNRPAEQSSDQDLDKIKQLFSLATKTGALFWCEEDMERIMRRKKLVLDTDRLDAEDYDRLVFLRVAQMDLGGAYDLLQEMHYAGTSPTSTTIHRVVTGVLHKLYNSNSSKKKKKTTTNHSADDHDDDDDDDDQEAGADGVDGPDEEDADALATSWTNGPSRLEDIPSFIQEWYNLYRVKPLPKTVVPVFARLLASNNVWEVKRLLQILDSMDGGLAPVVEFWLEKRLAAAGKTVDDLRVNTSKR